MLFFLSLVLAIMVILEIWSVNRLSTYGVKINKLEEAKNQIQLENDLLGAQIAKGASLLNVSEKSSQFGLEKIHHTIYL